MIIAEIKERRSVRDYSSRTVEKEKLERIMEAGRLAPSARNLQDWKIIVVDEPGLRDRLIAAAAPHQPFLKEAPVILVACGLNPGYVLKCGQPAYPIDLAIALDHMSLQAVREGLGTCWIGSFFEDQVKRILNIPSDVRIVELMSLGYCSQRPPPRKRKESSQLFSRNRW